MSALFIAAASRHHVESHPNYRPLESILLDQGFSVEYELDEFNPLHTVTILSRLQLWLCRLQRKNFAQTSSYFILRQHFQETFTLLTQNNQDHTFMGDYIIPVLNLQIRPLLHLWRPYHTQTFNNSLTLTMHISLQHSAAKNSFSTP